MTKSCQARDPGHAKLNAACPCRISVSDYLVWLFRLPSGLHRNP